MGYLGVIGFRVSLGVPTTLFGPYPSHYAIILLSSTLSPCASVIAYYPYYYYFSLKRKNPMTPMTLGRKVSVSGGFRCHRPVIEPVIDLIPR